MSGRIRRISLHGFTEGLHPRLDFGSVRVRARVGGSEWSTSIFPGSDGVYVLPLKKKVRDAESLVDGGAVSVHLEILDG